MGTFFRMEADIMLLPGIRCHKAGGETLEKYQGPQSLGVLRCPAARFGMHITIVTGRPIASFLKKGATACVKFIM